MEIVFNKSIFRTVIPTDSDEVTFYPRIIVCRHMWA